MPSFRNPACDSRHRSACFALYRALLRLGPRVPVPDDVATVVAGSLSPIKDLTRRSFRRNKNDTSPRLVVSALRNGYKFLDLLSRARNPTSVQNASIVSFLRQTLPHLRARRERAAQRNDRLPSTAPRPHTVPLLTRDPNAPAHAPVFRPTARPLPLAQLGGTGVRKVPLLDHSNGLPFLRLGPKTPRALSRVLRQRHLNREARVLKLVEMQQEMLAEAADEDGWERLVRSLMKLEGHRDWDDFETFEQPVQAAIRQMSEKLNLDNLEKVARGNALWDLVLKEKALAESEQRGRREKQMEQREARLRARQEAGAPAEE